MGDREHSVDKLRQLYEQTPTSAELTVAYAKGLVNLSFKQIEAVDVQENTQQAKKLLSKYPQNMEIQLSYAQTLLNLTLKQEPETLRQTVAQLRKFLLAFRKCQVTEIKHRRSQTRRNVLSGILKISRNLYRMYTMNRMQLIFGEGLCIEKS